MRIHCLRVHFQKVPIFVILGILCKDKHHNDQVRSKSEDSGWENVWIIKNIGAKLQQKLEVFEIFTYFLEKLRGQVSLLTPSLIP